LERYDINAELNSTLRCGFHKYTYKAGQNKKLIVNLAISNEKVRDWKIEAESDIAFKGYQTASEKLYFYAITSQKIKNIESLKNTGRETSVVNFDDSDNPVLEIKLRLSFVSTENAKMNLEAELAGKSFDQVKEEASQTWETLLSKIQVTGGAERQKGLFYS
jgi:putative alpha-1,2-mannosidase